ncbi:Nucleotide-binding universal stress protein, UspA family [Polaromonas sp. OV174]|uniref:universal stress protein n=1 Tax=Polaromonas sp. OV174 TaxID=1855300 RepID=UPI0008E72E44|nr:universal stress protein [Polaromonas sp. OV174]SFC25831.1 Nucleotide-binding universal stress protein, UspA family [Polaromonas sp. OV174]
MYQKILVPLDGSPTADRGLHEAIKLATGQKTTLYLLHVVNDFVMIVEMSAVVNYQEMLDRSRQFGEDLLSKAKNTAASAGVQAETLLREITNKRIAEVINDEAVQAGCDLIVMGTHGRRGFSRLTLGSEAEVVVRSCPVPVLMVRMETPKT